MGSASLKKNIHTFWSIPSTCLLAKEEGIQGDTTHTVLTAKYGSGLMFWRYFAASGAGALFKINCIINTTKYQDILAESLIASAG